MIDLCIRNNQMSTLAGNSLAELMLCTGLMSSKLKGKESLQVNIVGNGGMQRLTAVSDGDLLMRGKVDLPQFELPQYDHQTTNALNLVGEGQIQVIRYHPAWKSPVTGLVPLRDGSLAQNMTWFVRDSEQREAVFLTDVQSVNGQCVLAVGVMVERLPLTTTSEEWDGEGEGDAEEEEENSFERCKRLLQQLQNDGLGSYMSSETASGLHRILDSCLAGQTHDPSLRWAKCPVFTCTCGIDRVWHSLGLLPTSEVEFIVADGKDVQVKCDFCGSKYGVTVADITDRFLKPSLE
jgi:molecular chaperone Hsp33